MSSICDVAPPEAPVPEHGISEYYNIGSRSRSAQRLKEVNPAYLTVQLELLTYYS